MRTFHFNNTSKRQPENGKNPIFGLLFAFKFQTNNCTA